MTPLLKILLSLSISGIICQLMVFYDIYKLLPLPENYMCLANPGFFALLFLLFYTVFSGHLINKIMSTLENIINRLDKFTLKELIIRTLGSILGMVFASCLGFSMLELSFIGPVTLIFLNMSMAYLGFKLAGRKTDEVNIVKNGCVVVSDSTAVKANAMRPKILDTSVIIDGRILDIIHTGFIEGNIIIPNFVLDELRHIADSSDTLKRNRGRRGLDILNEIQKQPKVTVETVDWANKEFLEVDIKLIKMAEKFDAFVVTNDYNLNKVAEFTGISVLNINELANAIKPIVLPGEELSVEIVKDGKSNGQGIGYLNDGTMIVVEGGYKYIGETLEVLVTSILQTAAGRMIFTRIKSEA